MFKKRLFVVGEKLIANCTTSRAKPAPHITWLVNGEKVKIKFTHTLLAAYNHECAHFMARERAKMKIECPELLN